MNGRISVETHACGDSSKVMQEEKEAGSARIEKDTGGGEAALYRREERVDRRRVACRGGASRSRGLWLWTARRQGKKGGRGKRDELGAEADAAGPGGLWWHEAAGRPQQRLYVVLVRIHT